MDHFSVCSDPWCLVCEDEGERRAKAMRTRREQALVARDVAEADAYYAELKARLDERAPA